VTESWVRGLPKIDLHVHIDGAVRPATVADLAREGGMSSEEAEALSRRATVGPLCRSLADFLDVFEIFYPLLRNPDAVERISYELCELEASAGVVYFEARFAPVLQASEKGGIDHVTAAALRGLARGGRDFGVAWGLILCCYRTQSPASSLATVETAQRYRPDGVVGIDLAGDESFPALPHLKAFMRAREAGLAVTVHAGEAAGPENIREAVFLLGARRIGHGVHLFEDPDLERHVCEEGIALEVCLTSNLQTGAWRDLATHPFADYLRKGLPVTLNTDDPGLSRIDMVSELLLAADTFSLSREEILVLQNNALRAAFCSKDRRAGLFGGLTHES
jgi:adenosine deaminase